MGSFAAVPCLVSAVGRLLSVVLPPHTSRDAGTLPASRTRAAHLYTGRPTCSSLLVAPAAPPPPLPPRCLVFACPLCPPLPPRCSVFYLASSSPRRQKNQVLSEKKPKNTGAGEQVVAKDG